MRGLTLKSHVLIVCALYATFQRQSIGGVPQAKEHLLASGDSLDIRCVNDSGEMKFILHVDADGNLPVPGTGDVHVSGMTAADAKIAVDKALDAKAISATRSFALEQSAESSGYKCAPIAAGDQVRITVFDLNGLGQPDISEQTVSKDGKVKLKFAVISRSPLSPRVRPPRRSPQNTQKTKSSTTRPSQYFDYPLSMQRRLRASPIPRPSHG